MSDDSVQVKVERLQGLARLMGELSTETVQEGKPRAKQELASWWARETKIVEDYFALMGRTLVQLGKEAGIPEHAVWSFVQHAKAEFERRQAETSFRRALVLDALEKGSGG